MYDSSFGAGLSVSEVLKKTEANTANTRGVGLARMRGCLKVSSLKCASLCMVAWLDQYETRKPRHGSRRHLHMLDAGGET